MLYEAFFQIHALKYGTQLGVIFFNVINKEIIPLALGAFHFIDYQSSRIQDTLVKSLIILLDVISGPEGGT